MFRYFIALVFIFSPVYSQESAEKKRPSICLNMIVKNEKNVIQRCLNSVKGFIDYWVIVDTGSEDGTQDLIRESLKGIPGELHERPWVNFGHNRNEALEYAKKKSDYVFFIDADEQVFFSSSFTWPVLDQDCYFMQFEEKGSDLKFFRMALINAAYQDWRWEGVVHENLSSNTAKTSQLLSDVVCRSDTPSSARSQDSQKYQKDVALLEEALKNEPDNSRHIFYLAQSYYNCQKYDAALEMYSKRSLLPDKDEEVYFSLYMAAYVKQLIHKPFEEVLQSYKAAYECRPERAESLFRIGCLFLEKKEYLFSYVFFSQAASMKEPKGLSSIVEKAVYDYGAALQAANTAVYIGRYEDAKEKYVALKAKCDLPVDVIKSIDNNLAYLEVKKKQK